MSRSQASVERLRGHPLFTAVEDFTALERSLSDATVSAGKLILQENQPAESVFVLHEGIVRVFHEHRDGSQLTVKHLAAPTTFGEMEVLTEEPRYLESAAALTSCAITVVPANTFRRLVAENSALAQILLRDVCARFCVAARNEVAPFFDVSIRLASLLLAYAEHFGRTTDDGIQIHTPLTQEQLADGLGVTVRSIARAIKSMTRQELITRKKGWWIIRQRGRLEEMCGALRFNLNYRSVESA